MPMLNPTYADHIDLRRYAEEPSGVNDSAVIRSAFIDAAAGPKRLYIPRMKRSWKIGTPVLLDADVVIFGDGWGPGLSIPTIQLAAGLNDFGFKTDTTTTSGRRITVRDLEIDGNCSQQTAGGIFQYNNPVQGLFDAVHFHHAYDVALHFWGQRGVGPFGHHGRVVNSLFDNSAPSAGNGQAIRIQSADEIFVSNCDFETNGGAGSEPYHIKDWSGINSFVNNVFVGGGTCVKFQDISGSRFIGNMVDGVLKHGLDCSASHLQIVGNHFSGAGDTVTPNTMFHLRLDNGGYNTIAGNTFTSGGITQGLRGFISHQTSSTNNVISANVLRVQGGALGSGGVVDWNGTAAATQATRLVGNVGLADA